MRKKLVVLFLLAMTTFSAAGGLAGILVMLLSSASWSLGWLYAGTFFVTMGFLALTVAFVAGMNANDDPDDDSAY